MRERFGQLIGAAPRARRIGIGIGLGAIAAIIVLVVLGSADSTTAPDAYTIAANRLCLSAKQEIAQARRRYRSAPDHADPRPLAQSLVHTVGTVRARLMKLDVPSDRIDQGVGMESAMLESENRLLHLAQLETLDKGQVRTSAEQTEAVSADVRNAASSLGLIQCSRLALGVAPRAG